MLSLHLFRVCFISQGVAMSRRLEGFDYSRPLFYMVTLKCNKGAVPLSEIVSPGRCSLNSITRAFTNCILNFHCVCNSIEKISCFTIMPNHIHLLIKLKQMEQSSALPLRLELVVDQLMFDLENRYSEVTGFRHKVFDDNWHDWIVTRRGQLEAFTRYFRENPCRRWTRSMHSKYFNQVKEVEFLGRKWFGYGNTSLVEYPVLLPIYGSRQWTEEDAAWRNVMFIASRIGPGGVGVGTFMSPCERACGNVLGLRGGNWIVLSPNGFGPYWHPDTKHEAFCAQGRMLFLTLYPEEQRVLSSTELYTRCHDMVKIVVEGLKPNEQESYGQNS